MAEPAPSPFTLGDFVLVVAGGLIGAVVGALAAVVDPSPGVLLVAALIGQYGGHLLTAWLITRRRGVGFDDLRLEARPADGRFILFGAALQIILVLLFAPVAQLLGADEPTQQVSELIPSVEGTTLIVVLVVLITLVVPATEELMFRGFLYRTIETRSSAGGAVWVSAAVFAPFHLLGATTEGFWVAAVLLLPQLFIVGLILGQQVRRYERLGPSIFTHAGFNLVAVLALLLPPEVLQGG